MTLLYHQACPRRHHHRCHRRSFKCGDRHAAVTAPTILHTVIAAVGLNTVVRWYRLLLACRRWRCRVSGAAVVTCHCCSHTSVRSSTALLHNTGSSRAHSGRHCSAMRSTLAEPCPMVMVTCSHSRRCHCRCRSRYEQTPLCGGAGVTCIGVAAVVRPVWLAGMLVTPIPVRPENHRLCAAWPSTLQRTTCCPLQHRVGDECQRSGCTRAQHDTGIASPAARTITAQAPHTTRTRTTLSHTNPTHTVSIHAGERRRCGAASLAAASHR